MSYKVLVVDDEAPIGELFTDLLKKEDCALRCVSCGEEALAIINKEDFDIVLLDIKLSGMSGLEALKKIKEAKPDLTVIMITGFGYDEELIAKSKELGSSGYIGKNIPIPQMLVSLRSFLRLS